MRRKPPASVAEALALHPEQIQHEHDLEWAHWLFQGVRARCGGITFRTRAEYRADVLRDWETFAQETFAPVIAPYLLAAWKGAVEGDEALLFSGNVALDRQLPGSLVTMSIDAGEVLLHDTRGAKYQGALGKFRESVEEGMTAPHLAMVWAGLGAMFQVPPLDLLCEYLRQEWLVGTRELALITTPQGMLSFVGLAQKAMHHSLSLFTVGQGEVQQQA